MASLEIILHSDLCAGNGESVGNSVDTDVWMNDAGFPEIPARRIKGCLKQTAIDLQDILYCAEDDNGRNKYLEKVRKLFGDAWGQEGCLTIYNAVIKDADVIRHFVKEDLPRNLRPKEKVSSAPIPEIVKKMAKPANIEKMYSSVRGQTKLADGVKVENSLRFTRVISRIDPFSEIEEQGKLELHFYAPVFINAPDEDIINLFEICCQATRHIGTNRNRGLGNVEIVFHRNDKCSQNLSVMQRKKAEKNEYDDNNRYVIKYHIGFDAPITLPGCDEINTSIPARSVIGALAGTYLKNGSEVDEKFTKLFLDGTVRWSALTPVIEGSISDPVPMMLVKLKNDGNRMINNLIQTDSGWKTCKPKTMDGAFAAIVEGDDGEISYKVASPEIRTIYHNSINGVSADGEEGRNLYMQDSVEAGLVYGGTVICSGSYVDEICTLLRKCNFRFGRSKAAQYAACSLIADPEVDIAGKRTIRASEDTNVYVILKSDMALCENGIYYTENTKVRSAIATAVGLQNILPDDKNDYCRYHTVGGFNNMWHLQKQQIPVIKAGSLYCFKGVNSEIPESFTLGELLQEGFGECLVMTEEELKKRKVVEKGKIDHISCGDSVVCKEMVYNRILLAAGMEAMTEYALGYKNTVEGVPSGRLRLMLSEAVSYPDLLKLVDTIKESDLNSENKNTRRTTSRSLLKTLYEDEGKFSLEKILNGEKGLYDEIVAHPDVEGKLLEEWKKPLEIILHGIHYSKER